MHSWLKTFVHTLITDWVRMESGLVIILRELYQAAFKSLRFQFKISVHEPTLPSQVT